MSTGRAAWKLAVDRRERGLRPRSLDLTERLNTFNTHASLFDAHPNAAAQR